MKLIITNEDISNVMAEHKIEQVKNALKDHLKNGDIIIHEGISTGIKITITTEEQIDALWGE